MRSVIQRVSEASVTVGNEVVGRIQSGLLVYVGVAREDEPADIAFTARKIRHLRIFPDSDGRMNLDVADAGGSVLVVSNFTLMGDARKGRRPAFTAAAAPEQANDLYERLCGELASLGLQVEKGQFQQMMLVKAVNDGPINLVIDSRDAARREGAQKG